MHHPCIDLPNKHSFAMETVHSATHALTMDKPSIFKNIGKTKKHNHAMAMHWAYTAMHWAYTAMHYPCIGHALAMRFLLLLWVVVKW